MGCNIVYFHFRLHVVKIRIMYEQDLEKKVVISNKHRKNVLMPLLMVFFCFQTVSEGEYFCTLKIRK